MTQARIDTSKQFSIVETWYEDFLVRTERVSDLSELDPRVAGERWRTRATGYVYGSRLRNERDNPPGEGFKTLVRDGKYIEPSNYASKVSWLTQGFSAYESAYRHGLIESPFAAGFVAMSATDQNKLRDTAVRNIWAGLRRSQQVASLVLLAEFRQTLGMLGKTALTLISVIRSLKKGRFSDAVDALAKHGVSIPRKARFRVPNRTKKSNLSKTEWTSNAWLELQFGWKPLLDDLYSIASLTTDLMNGEYFPSCSVSGNGSFNPQRSAYRTGKYHYDCKNASFKDNVTVRLGIVNSNNQLLKAFGLTDPVSVVWELVPFSFVVDWFLPIGNYLKNLRVLDGLEILHVTEWNSFVASGTVTKYSTSSSNTVLGVASGGFVQYNRNILISIPPEPFGVTNPLDLAEGWYIMTALSLLEQKRRR